MRIIHTLLACVSLAACVTDDDAPDDVGVTIEVPANADGKADAISGKQLRVRGLSRLSPWAHYSEAWLRDIADLELWKDVRVDVATAETAVATGHWFRFEGTD